MRKKISILSIILGILLIFYPFMGRFISNFIQNKKIEEFKEEMLQLDDNKKSELKSHRKVGKMIGYIEIEKINIQLPIYEGTEKEILINGICHLENTSLPDKNGIYHTIFVGHTGLSTKILFDDLPKLNIGDKFKINIFSENFDYEICEIQRILPDETEKLDKFSDTGQYVTLITCVPKYINSHRLLVTGRNIK